MGKQGVKVLLHLNKRDQKELNYENADLTIDFESLMHRDFALPITNEFRNELIQTIKSNFHIPDAYLNDYQATFKEGTILVY